MPHAIKIAVFRWTGELPQDVTGQPEEFSRDYGEQKAYEDAYPPTKALIGEPDSLGVKCDGPWDGDLGWTIDGSFEETRFVSFLNWLPIESDDSNFFAVQTRLKTGFLGGLLGRRPSGVTLDSVRSLLARALSRIPLVADVRWLSEKEFDDFLRQ